MRQNVVFSLITLLEQSDRLHTKDATKYEACKIANITPELTEKIQLIQKYQKEPGDMDESNPDINYNELAQLALAIEYIWNLDGIQATFRNRANNFVFDDNMDFFYSKVKEIFTENYVPTNEDCLKNRIKTTGIVLVCFVFYLSLSFVHLALFFFVIVIVWSGRVVLLFGRMILLSRAPKNCLQRHTKKGFVAIKLILFLFLYLFSFGFVFVFCLQRNDTV